MIHSSSVSPSAYAAGTTAYRRAGTSSAALGSWCSVSTLVTFAAGLLTPFTVSLVGEMPVGELVLMVAAAWAGLCVIFNRAWPGVLVRHPLLGAMMVAQAVALTAYIFSDLYRQSTPHDMARGWGRMVFLTIDLVAVAYLFSRGRRNLVALVIGNALGSAASAMVFGSLFGDTWKFGYGVPVTSGIFLLAPLGGPIAGVMAGILAGGLHFVMDFRSYGGLCLVASALMALQLLAPRVRLFLLPVLAIAAVAAFWGYGQLRPESSQRATRSNVERGAMITAALEAVNESPLIGHGSWFSNSDVYDNFVLIRYLEAKRAHVGGFADPGKEREGMALHSQLLVALAEGGVFGGAFFFVFGGALLWALWRVVLVQPWHRLAPIYLLLLLTAFWNLLFSPFSGAHRVYIAMACGLVLLISRPSLGLPGKTQPHFPR